MSDTFESRVMGGRYRLVRQLGGGGMGSVWLAEHLSLSSPVAVKLLSEVVATTEEGLNRFWREARTAAALRSPHVVQILDYGVEGSNPYLVMELLDGESLDVRLQQAGSLTPEQVAHIFHHIGRAVGLAHDAGIVHRDLKPSNIFIIRNDDEEVIKLLDFGIAKARVDRLGDVLQGGTRTGEFLGTPYYTSPEQAEGAKTVDHRTDIWAMGVVAYECLLGRQPFPGETLGSVLLSICSRPLPVPSEHGGVPAGFDAWFARACARDVTLRYQSVREAAGALRSLCLAAASASAGAEQLEARARFPAAASRLDDSPPSSLLLSTPPLSTPRLSSPPSSELGESSKQPPSSNLTTTGAASSARALEKTKARPPALVVALGLLVGLGGASWIWGFQRMSSPDAKSISAAALQPSRPEPDVATTPPAANPIIAAPPIKPVQESGAPRPLEVQQEPATKGAGSATDEPAERPKPGPTRLPVSRRPAAGRAKGTAATQVTPGTQRPANAAAPPPDKADPAKPAAADPPDLFGLTPSPPKAPAQKAEPSVEFGLLPKGAKR